MSWKSYFILIAVVLLSALGIWLGHFLIGTCNIDWELIQLFQTAIICSGIVFLSGALVVLILCFPRKK